jgi:ADP-ribose pyrophosphatase
LHAWKTLSRSVLLDYSKYLVVERHTVQLPDGQVIEDWPWVITPDYACVVAVTPEGKYLCFRQVKYAIEGTTLAPAGGYLEPAEEPLAAAKRELYEETGYRASEWIDLGHYAVDSNRGAGTAYLYLALGARRVTEPDADDLEEQELLLLSRAEMEAALDAGAFKAVGWTAGVALALRQTARARPDADCTER